MPMRLSDIKKLSGLHFSFPRTIPGFLM